MVELLFWLVSMSVDCFIVRKSPINVNIKKESMHSAVTRCFFFFAYIKRAKVLDFSPLLLCSLMSKHKVCTEIRNN